MTSGDPIFVRTHGTTGSPVVVLHGGPGAPGTVASLAQALADAFLVLEPWQRRRDDRPLTIARHVEDLAEVAPDEAAYVGSSWGAMLALSFACLHPDRVTRIALVGCGTYDEDSRATYRHAMAQRLTDAQSEELATIRASLASAHTDETRDALWGAMGALLDQAQTVDAPPASAGHGPFDRRGARETWDDALRLQADGIEPARFSTIRCPVTMFHGAHDPHPGTATRDVLRTAMPHLRYVEFPNCGHEPWRERQACGAFLGALRAFLQGA